MKRALTGCGMAVLIYALWYRIADGAIPLWGVLPLALWLSTGLWISTEIALHRWAFAVVVSVLSTPLVYVSLILLGSPAATLITLIWLIGTFLCQMTLGAFVNR